ncbi:MAG: ATP-binding cassette domain-containing protein [Desulfobacterales bacterium]
MDGLVTRNLGLIFGATPGSARTVLQDVSAVFPRGALALVTGATGAGKSSLLHLLAGLLRPTTGEVLADGAPVSRWGAAHRDRWRRRVGIVFQSANLFSELSVLENVILPLVPRSRSLAALRAAGREVLAELALTDLAGAQAGQLSGGERQRAALARALVGRPDFLMADEPTAHQDPASAARVLQALAACRARGAVVVVAAHDPRVVGAGVADRHWQLAAGRLETG